MLIMTKQSRARRSDQWLPGAEPFTRQIDRFRTADDLKSFMGIVVVGRVSFERQWMSFGGLSIELTVDSHRK
jgi:hypothetical protein